jgi:hypothetical protein
MSTTSRDERSDSERFIDEAMSALAFLHSYGFELRQAEPDSTGMRGEDLIVYESPAFAIGIQRASYNDEVWGWFGHAGDEFAILSGIGFWVVFERLGLLLPKCSDSSEYIHTLTEVLRSGCATLLEGDAALLHAIWQEREDRYDALSAHQRAIAYRIERIGDAEILELPNTEAALGEDFLLRFADHDFLQDRIWLVCNAMGEFYCMDYNAARDFGGADQEENVSCERDAP